VSLIAPVQADEGSVVSDVSHNNFQFCSFGA
jgi:hypothetical protein